MIAYLGMYEMPALRAAHDRFWQGIRAQLGYGPAALTRAGDVWEIWRSADLLLAQTCGLPYRTRLHGSVTLVGTPDYGLPGCAAGYYNSVLVVHGEAPCAGLADLAGGRFAFNDALSQSGWAAPMTHLAGAGLRMRAFLRTGSHAASARAVADGRADLAAIDALSWELLCEHDPVTEKLRVLERTTPTPGLPYITAAGRDPAPIATAIRAALAQVSAADRAALHLSGLVAIPDAAYLAIPTPPGA